MGTHPIFESDFDCLTDMIMISVILQLLNCILGMPLNSHYDSDLQEVNENVKEKMVSDLIECDEFKMTNPYCASRLTREYNKLNGAKNGSCIVTNFANDKYIFSDG